MFELPKQEYPAEFKALAVKRVKWGEALSRVAREPGMGKRSGTGSRPPRTASSTRSAAKP